jgi:hypothetical protein
MRTKRPSAHRRLLAQKPARKTNVLPLKPTAAPLLRARALKASEKITRPINLDPGTAADPGPSGFDWKEM